MKSYIKTTSNIRLDAEGGTGDRVHEWGGAAVAGLGTGSWRRYSRCPLPDLCSPYNAITTAPGH